MEAVTSRYGTANQKIEIKFQFSRISTGEHPPTKKPEDSGYDIGKALAEDPEVRD